MNFRFRTKNKFKVKKIIFLKIFGIEVNLSARSLCQNYFNKMNLIIYNNSKIKIIK